MTKCKTTMMDLNDDDSDEIDPQLIVLRFGYLGKWSPCAYESLSTKGEDYYPCTLLYDSNFTLT
jgi:hypothetical protein